MEHILQLTCAASHNTNIRDASLMDSLRLGSISGSKHKYHRKYYKIFSNIYYLPVHII